MAGPPPTMTLPWSLPTNRVFSYPQGVTNAIAVSLTMSAPAGMEMLSASEECVWQVTADEEVTNTLRAMMMPVDEVSADGFVDFAAIEALSSYTGFGARVVVDVSEGPEPGSYELR